MSRVDEFLPSSFRDPSGRLYRHAGVLYRQVNNRYREDYDHLMRSGLYAALLKGGRIVEHEEVRGVGEDPDLAYKVIRPVEVPFISYPYEWGFSQLKDAALATLKIQSIALQHGMSLKDASAFNIQFIGHRPVLIDTLSFERYREGEPWVAYRQFCQHFLAPLALMSQVDVRLGKLLSVHLDGIPLDLAARLLPWRSRLNPALTLHLHAHAAAQKRYAAEPGTTLRKGRLLSRTAFLALLESLERGVRGLRWDPAGTAWAGYAASADHYTSAAAEQKRRLVEDWLKTARPAQVWDLGANVGLYSRIAAEMGSYVVAVDGDPGAVDRSYLDATRSPDARVLPLWIDLVNPSPALGWSGEERDSLLARGPADLVLALALIHHLAISNNVPLPSLADFFARAGSWLLLEFVPKDDPQTQKLLASREDIFDDYDLENLEKAFASKFEIREAVSIPDSRRRMYLMRKRR